MTRLEIGFMFAPSRPWRHSNTVFPPMELSGLKMLRLKAFGYTPMEIMRPDKLLARIRLVALKQILSPMASQLNNSSRTATGDLDLEMGMDHRYNKVSVSTVFI